MEAVRTVGRKIMRSYQEASKVVRPELGAVADGRREDDMRAEVARAGKKWGLPLDWDANWSWAAQNQNNPGRLAWSSHRIGCQA